ncbi:MAG: hypothetical protein CME61_09845 [Halobacteriovoraceae bacterium]|nr:hypothetical protein [Halobacteriovoraceae bacterium]
MYKGGMNCAACPGGSSKKLREYELAIAREKSVAEKALREKAVAEKALRKKDGELVAKDGELAEKDQELHRLEMELKTKKTESSKMVQRITNLEQQLQSKTAELEKFTGINEQYTNLLGGWMNTTDKAIEAAETAEQLKSLAEKATENLKEETAMREAAEKREMSLVEVALNMNQRMCKLAEENAQTLTKYIDENEKLQGENSTLKGEYNALEEGYKAQSTHIVQLQEDIKAMLDKSQGDTDVIESLTQLVNDIAVTPDDRPKKEDITSRLELLQSRRIPGQNLLRRLEEVATTASKVVDADEDFRDLIPAAPTAAPPAAAPTAAPPTAAPTAAPPAAVGGAAGITSQGTKKTKTTAEKATERIRQRNADKTRDLASRTEAAREAAVAAKADNPNFSFAPTGGGTPLRSNPSD